MSQDYQHKRDSRRARQTHDNMAKYQGFRVKRSSHRIWYTIWLVFLAAIFFVAFAVCRVVYGII